jgi:hypothetical protein
MDMHMNTHLQLDKLKQLEWFENLNDILMIFGKIRNNDESDEYDYLCTYDKYFKNICVGEFKKNDKMIEYIKSICPKMRCSVFSWNMFNIFYLEYDNGENKAYLYILENVKDKIYLGCGEIGEHPLLFTSGHFYYSSDGSYEDFCVTENDMAENDMDDIDQIMKNINKVRYRYFNLVKDLI